MKTSKAKTRYLTELALLVALVLVMSYTPLGYLPVGPLQLSLLSIPVAIGAMTIGPVAGGVLGAVFGLTSFFSALRGGSLMGEAMIAASLFGTFVTCVVARILMGLCTGWIFRLICRVLPRSRKLCCAVGGLSAPVLNTVFFMGSLVLFFYQTDYIQSMAPANPFVLIVGMVGIQGVIEAVLGCAVSTVVTVPLLKYLGK